MAPEDDFAHEISAIERRPRTRRTVLTAIAFWFTTMVVVSALAMARHEIALPQPATNDTALATALAALRGEGSSGSPMAVHVLYADCRCSHAIATHLMASTRPRGVVERVLLVGDDPALRAELTAHGIPVTQTTPAELESRYHVVAAPMLVVMSGDDRVQYAGGYAAQNPSVAQRDVAIIADVRDGRALQAYPVTGCAVSDKLRARINPSRLF